MAAKKIIGRCHICGEIGPLSFEHVPPEAAFNDHRVLLLDIEAVLEGKVDIGKPQTHKGSYQQRGVGRYTLCEKCNNNTGSWYASSYVNFARQVYPYSKLLPEGYPATLSVDIFPLRVLKQIVAMLLSVSPPRFSRWNSDMVRFVLNRDSRVLPDEINIWL